MLRRLLDGISQRLTQRPLNWVGELVAPHDFRGVIIQWGSFAQIRDAGRHKARTNARNMTDWSWYRLARNPYTVGKSDVVRHWLTPSPDGNKLTLRLSDSLADAVECCDRRCISV